MFFKQKMVIAVIASAISFSCVAKESSISYTNVKLAYLSMNDDDDIYNGASVGMSVGNDILFGFGEYTKLSSDEEFYDYSDPLCGYHVSVSKDTSCGYKKSEIKTTQSTIGIGLHTPVSDEVDILASVAFVFAGFDHGSISEDNRGYLITAGVKGKPTEVTEVGFYMDYVLVNDESDVGILADGRAFVVPTVSFGVGYKHIRNSSLLLFDVRIDI